MNTLCFASNLTSAEWAAWVQAVGSILAIVGAAGIAVWQARKQYESGLAIHLAEQRHSALELSKTLNVLAIHCADSAEFVAGQIETREAVADAATGRRKIDVSTLHRLDAAISSIALHSLPSRLVTPTMFLSATFRQFHEEVELALRLHTSMDADAFDVFFDVVRKLTESLHSICQDIDFHVQALEAAAPDSP